MTLALITLLLFTAALTAPAQAAPGDPRFVQGTLEWPAMLTREPVIVVRGDDGHVYYCDVTEAVRHRADGLRAGGRVSVLGIEAARAHELTSIAVGTGDAVTLARALSQGLAQPPAPTVAAGAVSVSAPAPAAPAAAAPPGPAPAAVSPAAQKASAGAASTAPAPPAPSPDPAAAPSVILAPGAPEPGAAAAPTGRIVSASVTNPVVAATPPPARRPGGAATAASGPRAQWSRLDGMVESVAGSTLTLKLDDGATAYIDISQLSPNVGEVLRQGTAVTVYGYPLEQRFEAAGYIQTNSQTNSAGPEPRGGTRSKR
jgi:hypothetical protein